MIVYLYFVIFLVITKVALVFGNGGRKGELIFILGRMIAEVTLEVDFSSPRQFLEHFVTQLADTFLHEFANGSAF